MSNQIFQGGHADAGIPQDSFAQFRDKVFGEQFVTSLQLLSMTKSVTQDLSDGKDFINVNFIVNFS